MKSFQFQHVISIGDAIRAVVDTGGSYLAGGTNLVDLMKSGVAHPPALRGDDIRRIGLTSVTATDAGGVVIEAGVTNSAIANHRLIRTQYPVLSQAILSGATTQLRNMATAGGNLLQRTRFRLRGDGIRPVQQAHTGLGLRRTARLQPGARRFWGELALRGDPSLRHGGRTGCPRCRRAR